MMILNRNMHMSNQQFK